VRSGRQSGLVLEDQSVKMRWTMSRGDCRIQHARSTRHRKTLGQCALLFVSLLLVSSQVLFRKPSSRAFREAISECRNFTQPLELDADRKYFPDTLSQMLLQIDHVFVLSFDSCKTTLSPAFSGRATCVVGRKLDVCAPRAYIRGPYTHAVKVSFMHATVLHLAQKSLYEHIVVLEDDAIIRHHALSANLVQEFRALLESNAWSIVRFGFRPYFLEDSSRNHCPLKCRCWIKKRVSEQFCELSHAGCDMRSSDFYVIQKRYYEPMRSRILDLRQADSKRIVDMRPMRQFAKQWLLLPQISIQTKLDIPVDYQIGLGALYVKKCVHPRPLAEVVTRQVFKVSDAYVSLDS